MFRLITMKQGTRIGRGRGALSNRGSRALGAAALLLTIASCASRVVRNEIPPAFVVA
jgi:hypothetical protein